MGIFEVSSINKSTDITKDNSVFKTDKCVYFWKKQTNKQQLLVDFIIVSQW